MIYLGINWFKTLLKDGCDKRNDEIEGFIYNPTRSIRELLLFFNDDRRGVAPP